MPAQCLLLSGIINLPKREEYLFHPYLLPPPHQPNPGPQKLCMWLRVFFPFCSNLFFPALFLEDKASGEEEMKAPFQPSLSRGVQKGEDVVRETLQSCPQPPESWQNSLARPGEAKLHLLANALF